MDDERGGKFWYAWGFLGGFAFSAVVLLCLGRVHDRRQRRGYGSAGA